MLGAIIGDIVGSRFEFNNHRSKDFELFTEDCFVTDDSIMTLAVAKAIMEAVKASPEAWKARDDRFHDLLSSLTVKYMQEIGRQYPGCGYGGRFYEWMFSDDPKPYKSYGNGAAMRVSPAGIIAESLIDAWSLAETVTAVTHNHKEGIKGAQATATSIYLAKTGALKSEIRKYTEADYYPLDFTIDAIRPSYRFNETCQQTVPQAIQCFLEAASFEDAIRTAISLGGDSDTLAAITGAIAGAYYGIPEALGQKALTYLDPRLRAIYDEWIRFCPPERERYKLLTKYIGKFSARAPGGPPGPAFHTRFPHHEFSKEWYSSAFVRTNYRAGLEKMKIGQLYDDSLTMAVEGLDAEEVLTLITAAFRHDHFDNGMLDRYLESGIMLKWLKRLKDIDWQERSPVIKEVELYRSIWPMFPRQYRVSLDGGKAVFEKNTHPQNRDGEDKQQEEAARVRRALEDLHFEYWLADYQPPDGLLVLDGEQWKLAVTYSDGTVFRSGGSNAYPDNWQQLLDFFGIDPSNQEEDPDDTNPSLVAAPGPEGLRASIEELRNELANQVLERDQLLYVTCRNIEMAYMLEIGGLEYRAYELECAVERLKRKMELLQAQKNRQEQIDLAAVEEILDMQLARYQAKLKEKIAKMNQAIEWGRKTPLTEEDQTEVKRLYRALVKALHPDLNPRLEKEWLNLFHKAVTAYEKGHLDELRLIATLVGKQSLPQWDDDETAALIEEEERLDQLIDHVKKDMRRIKSEYPYRMKSILENPGKLKKKRTELEAAIQALEERQQLYQSKVDELLR